MEKIPIKQRDITAFRKDNPEFHYELSYDSIMNDDYNIDELCKYYLKFVEMFVTCNVSKFLTKVLKIEADSNIDKREAVQKINDEMNEKLEDSYHYQILKALKSLSFGITSFNNVHNNLKSNHDIRYIIRCYKELVSKLNCTFSLEQFISYFVCNHHEDNKDNIPVKSKIVKACYDIIESSKKKKEFLKSKKQKHPIHELNDKGTKVTIPNPYDLLNGIDNYFTAVKLRKQEVSKLTHEKISYNQNDFDNPKKLKDNPESNIYYKWKNNPYRKAKTKHFIIGYIRGIEADGIIRDDEYKLYISCCKLLNKDEYEKIPLPTIIENCNTVTLSIQSKSSIVKELTKIYGSKPKRIDSFNLITKTKKI